MANAAKSQEQKNLEGTSRNDRVTPEYPDPVLIEGLPDPPTYLGKIGRKHWKKYTKMLQKQGILGENHLDSLGRYCMHLQIADEAADALTNHLFHISVNEQGEEYYMGASAVLKIFNDASTAALKLELQFGFTPVSMKQVPAPRQKKEGKLVKLMGGKRP
jgi:P27 family predicted phage terminase small subunit